MAEQGGRPFRVTATATDAFDTGNTGQAGVMLAAKLTAAGAAATAQLVDQNGTVLVDLSAAIGGSDITNCPIEFIGKVRVGTLAGAGAIVNVWIQ